MRESHLRGPAGQLAEAFGRARSVLFITGAGVSAESGLPTYRGVGGLYDSGLTPEGVTIETALSGEMLAARPEVCWKYILQIERACRGAQPNAAHQIIAELQTRAPRGWLLTQNVDSLHQRAGSKNMIEIHGNLRHVHCLRCDWAAEVVDLESMDLGWGTAEQPAAPRCPACGAGVRPRVVLFGEMLPAPALKELERQLRAGFDLVVSVGTTSVFEYIRAPILMAKRAGAFTAEVNPADTEVSPLVDLRIRAGAAAAFQALRDAL